MGNQSRRFVVNPDNKDAVSALGKLMEADREGGAIVFMSANEMEALNSKDVYELAPKPKIEVQG